MVRTIVLLTLSNFFMTFAWYGHLKKLNNVNIVFVILISWGIAFFEYCLQVPANRIGYGFFSLEQLKIMQEVITLVVFALFSIFYMNTPLTRNFLWAGLCLIGAVYFIFRDRLG
ncbi:MAG: DMT family protein [Oligoflexales bacterium]|nr:DMT family protein [Oligoflexales bacterium]